MIGLNLNDRKTKYMAFNCKGNSGIKTMNGNSLELVKDFKYLGSWVDETTNDMKVRIALAWQALNGMRSIWKSQLSDRLKLNFFTATVESVLFIWM